MDEEFAKAQEKVKTLEKRPGNDVLLKLYALFKQGNVGDVSGKKPGMTDFKGRAKYQAWESVKGLSQDDAKSQYIALVESLS